MKKTLKTSFICFFVLIYGCANNYEQARISDLERISQRNQEIRQRVLDEQEQVRNENENESNWHPILEGSSIKYNLARLERETNERRAFVKSLSNGEEIRISQWNGFLREHVSGYHPDVIDSLIDLISRHDFEYDNVENGLRVYPIRRHEGPYSNKSYIGTTSLIKNDGITTSLIVRYHGSSWIFADRALFLIDGERININMINFQRFSSGRGVSEHFNLLLTNGSYLDQDNLRIARRIAESDSATIRLYGQNLYSDIVVTDKMRSDIASLLRFIDSFKIAN